MTLVRTYPNFLNAFGNSTELTKGKNLKFTPKVNITEFDNEFLIELAVPGYSKKDISLSVEKNQLTVSTTFDEGESLGEYVMKQFGIEPFSIDFTLGKVVKTDEIKATVKSGILKITLAKFKKEELVKVIEVK